MPIDAHKLVGTLAGRTARNIYFWLLIIYSRAEFSYNYTLALITAMLLGLLAVLFYVNNLLLVPAYLVRKKYTAYFLFYLLLSATTSLGYIAVLKLMPHYYPAYHVGRVSPIVMGGETGLLTIAAFAREWWPYYMVLSVAGALFTITWYASDYQRQQKVIEKIRNEQLESELTFLKKQINPHFLFNSLNNLNSLIVNRSDDAAEVLSKISLIMRYLLYESDARLVSFEKEKEVMLAYIELELLRIGNTSNMHFSVSADREYLVPPLLWLPILENVFKHGTGFICDSYYADFRISIEKDLFMLHSRNTFKLVPGAEKQPGIGIDNLSRRLKLLYGDRCTTEFVQGDDLYTADMQINLAT